jgi:hypothetical protein
MAPDVLAVVNDNNDPFDTVVDPNVLPLKCASAAKVKCRIKRACPRCSHVFDGLGGVPASNSPCSTNLQWVLFD